MARLCRSVAQETDNFKQIDKEYAYAVFLIEKEFSVGSITEDYPAMKFFNLMDKVNLERYKNDTTNKSGGSKGSVNTFG